MKLHPGCDYHTKFFSLTAERFLFISSFIFKIFRYYFVWNWIPLDCSLRKRSRHSELVSLTSTSSGCITWKLSLRRLHPSALVPSNNLLPPEGSRDVVISVNSVIFPQSHSSRHSHFMPTLAFYCFVCSHFISFRYAMQKNSWSYLRFA